MANHEWGRKIGNVILWALGIFLVMCSTSYFESRMSINVSLLFVGGGILLLPPVHRLMGRIGGMFGIALGFGLFFAGAWLDEPERKHNNENPDIALTASTIIAEKPDFTKVTKTVIKSDMPPFKKSVEVYLSERITKAQVAAISKVIRDEAGSGYRKVFIGFHISNGGGMYWATGHHEPDLDARIVGMTREQYGIAKKRIENITLASGEKLLAKALILGSGWARVVLILKNGDGYIERTHWLPSDKSTDQPLTKKDGKYWSQEEGSTVNFRITRSRIEIHDNLGPISSGYRE